MLPTIDTLKNDHAQQRAFFDSGGTRAYSFRLEQLRKLKAAIQRNEQEILDALQKDLNKPYQESFMGELGILYKELDHSIKDLKKWMRPKRVRTPLLMMPGKSMLFPEPLGIVVIFSPWNYPFQLAISPLIGAIASGNAAVLLPSDRSCFTSALIKKIIDELFPPAYIICYNGPGDVLGPLLLSHFRSDHIFFTGSQSVARSILKLAAEHLTPVTLELGGKNPAIIDADVDLDIAAKRIVWAKYFNSGQTCIAPDHVLVHESIKEKFIERMIFHIKGFYGAVPIENTELPRIIDAANFDRLIGLMNGSTIRFGGRYTRASLVIEPTIVDEVRMEDPIMKEEIFGPVLPVLTWNDKKEIIAFVRKNRYPLALYLFSRSKKMQRFILENLEFGGGGINCALQNPANHYLPFGGVGTSGTGRCRGEYTFNCFTHFKAVMRTPTFIDPSIKYPPFSKKKFSTLKKLFGL